MYDLIIKNGVVIDGTGSPGYHADVAVKDGKIAKIGRGLKDAAKTIDAAGLVVTPGFIDSHGHADVQVLKHPDMTEKIEQGIIASVNGQCGTSNVPLSKVEKREDFKEIEGLGNEYDLRSDPVKYFASQQDRKLGSGMILLIGHGSLRRAVVGIENRAPSREELEQMKDLLRVCMEHGAKGLSFGLYYAPGSYATTEEAVEIAKVVAEYNGVVAAHVRNEAHDLAKSAREYLNILEQAGVRGVYSHHKATFPENWGKVTHTLRMLDEAAERGLDIYCDVYPYTATSTPLAARFLPSTELARGDDGVAEALGDPAFRAEMRAWATETYGTDKCDWVLINQCKAFPEYSGRYVSDIAAERGQSDLDAVYDIIRACRIYCSANYFTICEEDLETVIRHPRAMICTDAGVLSKPGNLHHPRMRGAFPRAIARYVREKGIVSLPEMIRKMTAMPARVYDLPGKGLVHEGMDADLCIFDPEKLRDKCTYQDCHARNEGLSYVLIAGEVVVEDGVYNGKRMAKAIL